MNWFNTEVTKEEFTSLRAILKNLDVPYEPSACGHLVHVEMKLKKGSPEYIEIEDFLSKL